MNESLESKEENTAVAACHIELFGGLRVRLGNRVITRFRTQKTSALLAFLAYHRDRMHSREVLIELFWPEAPSLLAGRTSLSVSLSALRHQLEPPGVLPESVLRADRQSVGLAPEIATDVSRFLEAARSGDLHREPTERISHYQKAVDNYRPGLLPGFYDEWIPGEQEQLAERFQSVARRLAVLYEEQGRMTEALTCALRATQAAPLSDESARLYIRLALEAGDATAAMRQFEFLERALAEEGQVASVQTQMLVAPFVALSATTRAEAVREAAERSEPMPRTDPPGFAPGESLTPPSDVGESADSPRPASDPPADRSADTDADAPRTAGHSSELARQSPGASLPIPLTRFFGRELELTRLGWLLRTPAARLVTLTGPGGVGKTRLALQVAAEVRRGTPGVEVRFVPLSDVTEAAALRVRVAEALGLPPGNETAPADLVNGLREVLRNQTYLLVLDNFEQIPREGADFVRTLLETVPALTCLITSRHRLPIPGEREFAVLPLPAPPPYSLPFASPLGQVAEAEAARSLEQLAQESPSVSLFVDRAQLARPDFYLTARNAAAVVELVTRLEGIPLALELAAARARVATPQQMLAQLSRRLDLATSGSDADGRHQSLRGMLRWSFDLLPPRLQRFLAQLAVFRGRWDAEAAETVTRSGAALDDLAALCDASLLRAEESGDTMRFSLLETVREFAEERLRAESEAALAVMEERHRAYFASVLEATDAGVPGRDSPRWLERIESEYENFAFLLQRHAARVAEGIHGGDAEAVRRAASLLVRLITGLQRFWLLRGRVGEARRWLEEIRELRVRARRVGSLSPVALDPADVARILNGAGVLAKAAGDLAMADGLLRRSLYLRVRLRDGPGVAATLNNLATVASERGAYDAARARYEASLDLWQRLGDRQNAGRVIANIAAIASEQGDLDAALALFRESLSIAREVGDRGAEAVRLRNLGEVCYRRGDTDTSRLHCQEALVAALHAQDTVGIAFAVLYLGIVTEDPGHSQRYTETAVRYCAGAGIAVPSFTRVAAEGCSRKEAESASPPDVSTAENDLRTLATEICGGDTRQETDR